MIVVGAPNSSNSQRLKEVAERAGCPRAALVQRAADIDWEQVRRHRPARRHRRRLGAGSAGRGNPRRLRAALHDERRKRLRRRGGRVLPAAPPAAGAPGGGVTLAMAVYTDVAADELTRFLSGTTSANCSPTRASPRAWRIPTSWCTPARAISFSRSTKSASAEKDLPFFLALMEHLAARGITCPQPVKNSQGGMLGKIAGRPAAIVTFLDGLWIRRPNAGHCAAVGEALAALHLAGADFKTAAERAVDRGLARPLPTGQGDAATACGPDYATRSLRSSARSTNPGRAIFRKASSTPTCSPTTSSSSATFICVFQEILPFPE